MTNTGDIDICPTLKVFTTASADGFKLAKDRTQRGFNVTPNHLFNSFSQLSTSDDGHTTTALLPLWRTKDQSVAMAVKDFPKPIYA